MAIHGHTKIELTNIKTGETKKYEDNNMMTNALDYLFHPMGICGNQIISGSIQGYSLINTDNSNNDKFLKSLTGGLLLLDKHLPDDKNMTMVPGGVHMTGHASYREYQGEENTFGSYNSTESGKIYDGYGYKHVWDFGVDKGNGDISCACLTTAAGGVTGSGVNAADTTAIGNLTANNNGSNYESSYESAKFIRIGDDQRTLTPVYLDGANDRLITLSYGNYASYYPTSNQSEAYANFISSSFLKTHDLTFYIKHFPLNKVSMFDFQFGEQLHTLDKITVHLKELDEIITDAMTTTYGNSDTSNDHYHFNYKIYSDEGYIYFLMHISPPSKTWYTSYRSVEPNELLAHVWKINAENFTVEKYYKIMNTTEKKVWIYYNKTLSDHLCTPGSSKDNNMMVTNKKFMCHCGDASDKTYMALINLEDLAIVDFIVREDDIDNIQANPVEINLTSSNNFYFKTVYNNKIYMMNVNNTYLIRVIDLENYSYGFLNNSFHKLGAYAYNNVYINPSVLSKVYGIKEPLFFYASPQNNASGWYLRLFNFPNVLVTINNLPKTITKTEDEIMKITYTILDDGYEKE